VPADILDLAQQHNREFMNCAQLDSFRQLRQISIVAVSLCWGWLFNALAWANTPNKVVLPPPAATVPKIPPLDTTIVPGKRVGPITPNTTYADLVKLFGKQRLTAKKVYGAEGQVEFPGTAISLGKNRSITVAWRDAKKLRPFQVIINDPTWKTAEGIGLGTSLATLRQVLGEFKITGLYWDYGNQVIDLSPRIQARYTGLSISVDADYTAGRRFPADLKAVTGDRVALPASNPHWKPLKMNVSALSVYFPETAAPNPKK
jgi:hypothetical protein